MNVGGPFQKWSALVQKSPSNVGEFPAQKVMYNSQPIFYSCFLFQNGCTEVHSKECTTDSDESKFEGCEDEDDVSDDDNQMYNPPLNADGDSDEQEEESDDEFGPAGDLSTDHDTPQAAMAALYQGFKMP